MKILAFSILLFASAQAVAHSGVVASVGEESGVVTIEEELTNER